MKKIFFYISLLFCTNLTAQTSYSYTHDLNLKNSIQKGDPAMAHNTDQVMQYCEFSKQIVVTHDSDHTESYLCIYNGNPL